MYWNYWKLLFHWNDTHLWTDFPADNRGLPGCLHRWSAVLSDFLLLLPAAEYLYLLLHPVLRLYSVKKKALPGSPQTSLHPASAHISRPVKQPENTRYPHFFPPHLSVPPEPYSWLLNCPYPILHFEAVPVLPPWKTADCLPYLFRFSDKTEYHIPHPDGFPHYLTSSEKGLPRSAEKSYSSSVSSVSMPQH